MGKKAKFHCKSEAQKIAIRRSYAKKAQKEKTEFPEEFPFWARMKIDKHRTTLVIDEDQVRNKKTQKLESGFVHREATHTYNKDFEEIKPNPDKDDPNPMYLKRPRKLPKRMFVPHNKDLNMPEYLRRRYEKNSKKDK